MFSINKCQHFMTIKKRELQKLYKMFIPKPFVRVMFHSFCSFESETILADLKGLQRCLLWWEPTYIQGTLKRTWLFTHLAQHEAHLTCHCHHDLKCYGYEGLLIGLETVVSLKNHTVIPQSISVVMQATGLLPNLSPAVFSIQQNVYGLQYGSPTGGKK